MRRITKRSSTALAALCLLLFLPVIVQAQETIRSGTDNWTAGNTGSASLPAEIVSRPQPITRDHKKILALSLLHDGQAEIKSKQPRYDVAEKSFLRATELDPTLLQARFGLAYVYNSQGRYSEAEKVYKQILRLLPESDSAKVHYNLGLLYVKQGNRTLSQEELKAVAKLDKKLAQKLKPQIDALEQR
jgi:tetratricopeptide (TPR) repeat protein